MFQLSFLKTFRFYILIFTASFSFASACGGNDPDPEVLKAKLAREAAEKAYKEYLTKQQTWADSVYALMSEKERIGQLIMATTYSNLSANHVEGIEKLIKEYAIGGLIFMQGGPVRQVKLVNRYQKLSKIPLMIAMDAEYGLAMRLDSTLMFPKSITLGAIQNERMIYEMGGEIARQIRRVGAHIDFAPVADINTDPENPVIGFRSFGEEKGNVAKKAIAYMKGLQHNGVIASAKHFPGHGDTNADSHYSLPLIKHSKERILETELFPFKEMIADSVLSVMVAHLNVPALDSTPNLPTSLSKKVITDLLIDSLGFKGLVFTDALNMQGVAKYFKPGEIAVKALVAGNDILLSPEDIPACITAVEKAIADGTLNWSAIEFKAKKILKAKYFLGLNHFTPISENNVIEDLNTPKARAIKQLLYEQAFTIASNKDSFLPISKIDSINFASLSIGEAEESTFQRYLSKYTTIENLHIAKNQASTSQLDQLYEKLKEKDAVFVGLHNMNNRRSRQYGLSNAVLAFIKKLEKETKVVPVVFGNPYSLKYLEESDYLVCAYEDDTLAQIAAAQALFGAVNANGKLPVTASEKFKAGDGIQVATLGRMGFGVPEIAGMESTVLAKIDSIVKYAIGIEAAPGCQILVARDGRIVYDKSFGHHTYSKKTSVSNESVYDIASLSKVLGTLQAVMMLEQQNKIDLDKKASDYLPELANTNKENMVIKDILSHQAGLKAFYPFWSYVTENGENNPNYLSYEQKEGYSVQISPDLFALDHIADSVWQWLIDTDLARNRYGYSKPTYRYSDLGFMMMKRIVERVSGQPLDQFLSQYIYQPLGLKHITYNPIEKIDKDQIVPTEMDIYQRKGLVHGYVHDPASALSGGVDGHAGLFSNAYDISVVLQMNLQEGFYGGNWYIQPETIAKFNHRYFDNNRRGLGWDKPPLRNVRASSSELSSDLTFGHTGFTGTCGWVDPAYNLVYVFLSNRIHPFVGNQKLIRENIRTKIQDVIYESLQGIPIESVTGRAGK
ncbi:glycoside hydrolase family 3 N-terminal domain-containing protein [Chondrinema litorale]|uniref:glycoside hydrolase family 3 N-terminal domain-containing protein n=1 Tax=Chondrinema litorale TaxID=2994555 RepID=UPI0025438996|nr:glycoside hydrolase family 3 N-terminal domain-containing protein [Chondrinema litorale]UZR95719.1 serine hydrolase [Chondrinema litorale]